MMIPFNRPHLTGHEFASMAQAHNAGQLAGDGHFTKHCETLIAGLTRSQRAFLTHSCTAALEMAALLADIGPGDEVIMPSYTFTSTANAFVLRGGVPVFVDIRPDTLNIDETLIESAITSRTRAIVVVHYAGVACDMAVIARVAQSHGLLLIEDAAQALMSSFESRPLGSIGQIGCLSFHETKNIMCGEGGALLLNDPRFVERAEMLRDKGTNRSRFVRGEVDKYTWCDMGSSYGPGELVAAFLAPQLEAAQPITQQRLDLWHAYHEVFADHERTGRLRRPVVPPWATHNAHMYYVLLPPWIDRAGVIQSMRERGASPVFHYVPLHSSVAGRRFGRAHGKLPVTDDLSARLLRMPLWIGVDVAAVADVFAAALAEAERGS
jgi:dTDP-4-amino-4,6-dideoxygalactose transaminase